MVSMFSSHFFNWTEQLKDSGHEIYWLDVFDSNTYVKKIDFVEQIIGWRNKVKYPGRYVVKHKLPKVYNFINIFNQRKLIEVFIQKLDEIQPDVVHSFTMHLSCIPIVEVMKKNKNIKWIYSAWGSDLYVYINKVHELDKIIKTLPHIDYMFVDCNRDFKIAKKYGFSGRFLGVFPGRGGYDLNAANKFLKPFQERNSIVIKGYQEKHGKCIEVLKAISKLGNNLQNYNIVVFGAHHLVQDFVKNSRTLQTMPNFKVLAKLGHNEVLEIMGNSIIYIGNSTSDGMPNTLLEAIIMEVFPIQSNPGGATAEIIEHEKNGLLIENSENIEEIVILIQKTVENSRLLKEGIAYNTKHIKPKLERDYIKQQVLKKYKLIQEEIECQA